MKTYFVSLDIARTAYFVAEISCVLAG